MMGKMSSTHSASKTKPIRNDNFDAAFGALNNISGSTPERWICNHHANGSDIEAYVVADNCLEVIAQTRQTQNIDAKANASLIVRAVNDYEKHQSLIAELISALELCLASDTLSWEAEQEAEIVVARAKQIV